MSAVRYNSDNEHLTIAERNSQMPTMDNVMIHDGHTDGDDNHIGPTTILMVEHVLSTTHCKLTIIDLMPSNFALNCNNHKDIKILRTHQKSLWVRGPRPQVALSLDNSIFSVEAAQNATLLGLLRRAS